MVGAGQDLAVSRDHSLVAAARLDGDVLVFKVGWDDTVRIWSMTSLEDPAAEVKSPLEAVWGTGLADALQGGL